MWAPIEPLSKCRIRSGSCKCNDWLRLISERRHRILLFMEISRISPLCSKNSTIITIIWLILRLVELVFHIISVYKVREAHSHQSFWHFRWLRRMRRRWWGGAHFRLITVLEGIITFTKAIYYYSVCKTNAMHKAKVNCIQSSFVIVPFFFRWFVCVQLLQSVPLTLLFMFVSKTTLQLWQHTQWESRA